MDLQSTAWLRNPKLYDLARAEAEKAAMAGSRLCWYKTLKAYEKLGGRLEDAESATEPGIGEPG